MSTHRIDTDYLVVGAGASAMAFIDTLLSETSAQVVVVDRQGTLRRGDKALGRIEGSSLPFLDTSPLTHHDPGKTEVDIADGQQKASDPPSNLDDLHFTESEFLKRCRGDRACRSAFT
jgi:hypothetical protein